MQVAQLSQRNSVAGWVRSGLNIDGRLTTYYLLLSGLLLCTKCRWQFSHKETL